MKELTLREVAIQCILNNELEVTVSEPKTNVIHVNPHFTKDIDIGGLPYVPTRTLLKDLANAVYLNAGSMQELAIHVVRTMGGITVESVTDHAQELSAYDAVQWAISIIEDPCTGLAGTPGKYFADHVAWVQTQCDIDEHSAASAICAAALVRNTMKSLNLQGQQ